MEVKQNYTSHWILAVSAISGYTAIGSRLLCLVAKWRMMAVLHFGSRLARLQRGLPGGPRCLNRPFEAAGSLSAA